MYTIKGAWQLFIRPIRVSYEEEDLGPQYMRFGERRYLRKDFEVCCVDMCTGLYHLFG